MANDLAEYRTSVQNTLSDTGTKYTTTIIDEALRRVLNEYSRVFPDFAAATLTLTTSGRTIALTSQTDLIAIYTLLHPYDASKVDPFEDEREDYRITWVAGVPQLHFSGSPIPVAGEKVYLEYARAQKVKDLDAATATTVRADHKQIIIAGTAGQCALIRSQSLNETWGGRPGDMPNLSQWGSMLYIQFQNFLKQVRQELNINPFTETGWQLDEWDT